jgi:hypothetical protein
MALEERRLLATFPVTSTADPATLTPGTLRYAVAQANAATTPSTIEFELGPGPATVALLQGQLELSNTNAATTIDDGPCQGPVTVSGSQQSRVFQIDGGVTASISGLTITGGLVPGFRRAFGGGVYSNGTTTLTDCTISGNTARLGGGVSARSGALTLTNCTVSGNTTGPFIFGSGGGVDALGATATLTDCTVTNNSAYDGAGCTLGTATLTHCTISGNSASSPGFGGGGLRFGGGSGNTATLTNCTIRGNSASYGAGVYNEGDNTVSLADCTLSGNSATAAGGGVFSWARAVFF